MPDVLKLAAEFNRRFTSSNGVDVPERVSVSRDEWRQLFAALSRQPAIPKGWIPCIVTHDGQHPEEVAYGPQRMMERLKKWLERYFEMKVAQQPATGEPVAVTSWKELERLQAGMGSLASIFPADTAGFHVQLYTRPAPSVPADVVLDCYDAGILNDFGGGNVEWWQDYIRAELGNAHDFYQSQIAHHGITAQARRETP